MASLEPNKLSLETMDFSLSEMTRAAISDVAEQFDARQTTVCCLLDPSLPDRVAGDAARLREVIASLLLTSLPAAHACQVKLSVFRSGERSPDVDVTFEITHASPPAAPFPAGAGAASAEIASHTKRIAQLLGGEMGIESNSAAAPVFWCRVPLQYPIGRPDDDGVRTERISDFGVDKFPVRILMAEDNTINQRVGKLILQRAGYKIDLVGDGSEALEAYKNARYDLILMDCQMPTMDGFEATRRIRSVSVRQPVIIAVTANALVGERERCLAAGMDDYLSKPFQAEQLIAIVEKWADAAVRR